MRNLLPILFSLILLSAFFNCAYPQDDLNTNLSKLTQDAAGQYVAPLISGFGADMNSGWLSRIPDAQIFGVDINFRIIGMGAFFDNANKTLSANTNFRFNRNEAELLTQNITDENIKQEVINQILSQDFNVGIQGPTAVGKKNEYITVIFKGHTFLVNGEEVNVASTKFKTDVYGALGDLPFMPLAAPQLTVGTVLGSCLSIRYLPSVQFNSDLGKMNYFGIGVMHNPNVWLGGTLPVDLGIGVFIETMNVGDIFKSKATQFSLFAGKTLGPSFFNVQPYAGISVETSTIKVNYIEKFITPLGEKSEDISFDLKGDNTFKFTLGTSFKFSLISLNVDYSLASYSTLSIGIGVDF